MEIQDLRHRSFTQTMNLAVFDIDGTLTQTDHVDDICFLQALADSLQITDISTDWAAYPHTTDSAILNHIFVERFKSEPTEADLNNFKKCFVNALAEHCAKDSSLFAETAGASHMLRQLNQETEWRVAIASGAWRVSGALKLGVAGIEVNDYPASFADDALSREDILQSAVARAKERYQLTTFARVVSIGDGLWDVRTARNLLFPFLGVGSGAREERLRQAGATHVLEHFADYGELMRCLEEAQIPKGETSP